jgi:hypothetical protein
MTMPLPVNLAPDAMVCADGVCSIPEYSLRSATITQKEETLMSISAVSPNERFEIIDLINRYATAIDIRDWDLFQTAFTDDAKIDYGFGKWDGAAAFTTFMRETHAPAGRTLHRMNNVVITDTDPFTVRTYGEAVILEEDNLKGTAANGWYDDVLARTERGLQISQRNFHMISMRNIGPNLAAEM